MSDNILIFYGSYRRDRQGIQLANYLVSAFAARGATPELVDAQAVNLPMLDRMYKEYARGQAPPEMEALACKIRSADAFVFVTGEYNWGIQPGLKNLTDHFLGEWAWRPAAIASYSAGRFAGARAGLAWHGILSEMGMVVISSTLAVGAIGQAFGSDGEPAADGGPARKEEFTRFADDLAWWTEAARAQGARAEPPTRTYSKFFGLKGMVVNSERLIALTDGVVAVVITIMVLELKPPPGEDLRSLAGLWPTFLSFALSFVYVAIYWNNHHHLFRLVPEVNGSVMWANLNLLFWLSLIPFTTAWMNEHERAPVPVALYGGSLLLCALSWLGMQQVIMRAQGPQSPMRHVLGRDLKGKLSPLLYLLGIAFAFVWLPGSYILYTALAFAWLVPDQRFEAAFQNDVEIRRPK